MRDVGLSVIMPVFNAETFLAPAIASVLGQTYGDFELIAINDGSSDQSLAILEGFAAKDPRVRIVSHENRGIVAALNEGLILAGGEIVARMDADDICLPSRLERQLAYLSEHPEVVAVGSVVLLVDSEGLPIAKAFECLTHEEIDASNLRGASGICHPAAAMRRSALLEIGGYREEFAAAEDMDLFLRLAEQGRLANIDEVLLRYRLHLASIGHARAQLQRSRMLAAVASARQRRNLPPLDEDKMPTEAPSSIADVHRKWAWWALAGGHLRAARKHALRAARLDPLKRANVRLLACVARGR